ncbi:MAG TPA: ribosome biogenesis GTPase Der [Tepidisphaeraceae bacterium]|nr:ribosome biogenesis GTPase Der [Tepidisphaeraceae bacterium]
MSSLPIIAIVGRPNVGKSSLLNALAGRRISIVQDMPGVTRDRVSTPIQIGKKWIEIVDTGGYGFDDPDLRAHIHQQIEIAMSQAKLVLFVVDCVDGLTSVDQEIAQLLRKKEIKTILIANKADAPAADVALGDFARLGFDTPIGVSALNHRNLDEVLDAIRKNIDLRRAPTELPPPQLMIAIVGKRNAGKSTLVNAIARLYEGDPQRVIVSEVAGTTRDSVDVRFQKDDKTLIVIDTAGVRKKRQMVTHDIEYYSFHRAQRSIRRGDVVMMLVDGTEPLSEPDRKLAQYIAEELKPVMLVVNKWDLSIVKAREIRVGTPEADISDEDLMKEFIEYLHTEMPQISYAPVAFVTAKDGRNVQAALDMAQHLFKQANDRVGTGRLNSSIEQIFEERVPVTSHGQRAKIMYATQISSAPPTIVLFVNNPNLFDVNYQRFVINRLREMLPFQNVPIKLVVRARQRDGAEPQKIAKRPPVKRPQPRHTNGAKSRKKRRY